LKITPGEHKHSLAKNKRKITQAIISFPVAKCLPIFYITASG
jgi:hypothetical protein